MLGVLVWIVVILLICFSVTGWHWIIFYVVILPFSTLLFFFYPKIRKQSQWQSQLQ